MLIDEAIKMILTASIGIIGAYLLGSISSAIVVCKALRLPDPRAEGSGNPGATNVLRIGGKLPAALTLLGDILKAFLPVLIMRYFTTDLTVLSVVMLAAIVGHVYPVFFQFKGGKGVATLIGGLAALSPLLCSIYLLTWLAVFGLTRLSSLSALVATATMPLWALWIARGAFPACVMLAVFIFWRHRSNIQHLLAGKEKKSTFK